MAFISNSLKSSNGAVRIYVLSALFVGWLSTSGGAHLGHHASPGHDICLAPYVLKLALLCIVTRTLQLSFFMRLQRIKQCIQVFVNAVITLSERVKSSR